MKNKLIFIYFSRWKKIFFGTFKYSRNRITEKDMSCLIEWLENPTGKFQVNTIQGKIYNIYASNILYTEIRDQ
jgi:hypothetical protein